VGFERCGKRSVLKAARELALDGVTWLPRPSVLVPLG